MWRRQAVPANPAIEVVKFPDADHSLQLPGDPLASLETLGQLTRAIGDWFEA